MTCLVASGQHEKNILDALEPLAQQRGLSVVRVTSSPSTIQIMLDNEDGNPVTVGACAAFSKVARASLAALGLDNDCELEISSPGLSRPLTRLKDFARFALSQARIRLNTPGPSSLVQGQILGTNEDSIIVQVAAEDTVSVPFHNVKEACLL